MILQLTATGWNYRKSEYLFFCAETFQQLGLAAHRKIGDRPEKPERGVRQSTCQSTY